MSLMMVVCMRQVYNPLMKRIEIEYLFNNMNGKLSRKQAVEQVSKELGKPADRVFPIKLEGKFGSTDVNGLFYAYDDLSVSKLQLKKYHLLRLLPKEERKKIQEEKRKKKSEKKVEHK
jgi:small subunit ribosomal protein S24e